jgi:hypothetical protein
MLDRLFHIQAMRRQLVPLTFMRPDQLLGRPVHTLEEFDICLDLVDDLVGLFVR